MFDEPSSLFDALLDLHARWGEVAHQYERHAADLVSRLSGDSGMPAGAYLGVCADLSQHMAQWMAIQALRDDLENVLSQHEDGRVSVDNARPSRVVHTPPVLGAGGAEPF